jgi:hypothetical protein
VEGSDRRAARYGLSSCSGAAALGGAGTAGCWGAPLSGSTAGGPESPAGESDGGGCSCCLFRRFLGLGGEGGSEASSGCSGARSCVGCKGWVSGRGCTGDCSREWEWGEMDPPGDARPLLQGSSAAAAALSSTLSRSAASVDPAACFAAASKGPGSAGCLGPLPRETCAGCKGGLGSAGAPPPGRWRLFGWDAAGAGGAACPRSLAAEPEMPLSVPSHCGLGRPGPALPSYSRLILTVVQPGKRSPIRCCAWLTGRRKAPSASTHLTRSSLLLSSMGSAPRTSASVRMISAAKD